MLAALPQHFFKTAPASTLAPGELVRNTPTCVDPDPVERCAATGQNLTHALQQTAPLLGSSYEISRNRGIPFATTDFFCAFPGA